MKRSEIFAKYWRNNPKIRDIIIIIVASVFIFALTERYEIYDQMKEITKYYENYGSEQFVILGLFLAFALAIYAFRRTRELKEEHKKRNIAEKRLVSGRAQLEAVLDGVPDMILQVDENMRIRWANREALQRNPNAIGMYAYQAFNYEEGTFIDSYTKWAMELKQIKKGITYQPFMSDTDQVNYWESIGVPLTDKNNNVYSAIAIARDITSRMRVEHTWNLLTSIVESTEDAIYGVHWNGTILSWNLGAEKIYGYSANELVGKSIKELVPFELRESLLSKIEYVSKKERIERFETVRITSEGRSIFVAQTICPFVDATGKKIGVSIIDRDITEAVYSEHALKESEEKFRTLVTTAPDGIVLTDLEGKIIELNDAFANMLGYRRDELTGTSIPEFLPEELAGKMKVNFSDILKKGKSLQTSEFSAITKSGKKLPVELSLEYLNDEDGATTNMIAIIRNVTERKKIENELKKSREQMRSRAMHLESAREAERKKIAFEIHDELGYLLTALKLDVSWLSQKINPEDKKLSERFDAMEDLIETTIKKVRTISTKLRPSILDHFGLAAAIEWQADEFQRRTGVRCKFDTNVKELKLEDGQATAIFRIFQETLTNVTRHAKASRVDVELTKRKDFLTLMVVDNGVGIPESKLKGGKSTFGLLGMSEKANFMGGKVKIESKENSGTKITLKVPLNNSGKING